MFAKIILAVLIFHWLIIIREVLNDAGRVPKPVTKGQAVFVAVVLSSEIACMIYVASQVRS